MVGAMIVKDYRSMTVDDAIGVQAVSLDELEQKLRILSIGNPYLRVVDITGIVKKQSVE